MCLQNYGLYPGNVSKLLQMLDNFMLQSPDFADRYYDDLKAIHVYVVSYRSLGAVGGERYLEWYDRTGPEDIKPVISKIATGNDELKEAIEMKDESIDDPTMIKVISAKDVNEIFSAMFFGSGVKKVEACAAISRVISTLLTPTSLVSSSTLPMLVVNWLSRKLSQSSRLSRALKDNQVPSLSLFRSLNLVKDVSILRCFYCIETFTYFLIFFLSSLIYFTQTNILTCIMRLSDTF
ncbi:unnamed protein product [Soboliphyme baturini]|uniref:Cytochrome P450 n=1 Tax=Soboliphyme baturini TaxID=241478 RepID=A0A183J8W9_9BILA|nr:unnamed protein product [Soboliphyme baturini]